MAFGFRKVFPAETIARGVINSTVLLLIDIVALSLSDSSGEFAN